MSFEPLGKPYRRIVTRAGLDDLLIEEKRNEFCPKVLAYAPMAGDQFRVTLRKTTSPEAVDEIRRNWRK